jgi:hypothetical protein
MLGTFLAIDAAAQSPIWFLENHGYYDAVLAEPRAAQTTVLFSAVAESFPFAVNDRRGLGWDISVGTELVVSVKWWKSLSASSSVIATYLRRPLHGPHLLPAVHLPKLHLAGSQEAEEQ